MANCDERLLEADKEAASLDIEDKFPIGSYVYLPNSAFENIKFLVEGHKDHIIRLSGHSFLSQIEINTLLF